MRCAHKAQDRKSILNYAYGFAPNAVANTAS
jgi:hypothetical protein